MKLNPGSLLVLAMFCSFAVVLTVMIAVFRPRPQVVRPQPDRVRVRESPAAGRIAHLGSASQTSVAPGSADATGPPPKDDAGYSTSPQEKADPLKDRKPAVPARSLPSRVSVSAPGRQLQRRLKQEQKEMGMLKAEMERRLKAQLAVRERKLTQLAQTCEKLEPGEVAHILRGLDDKTVAQVLRRLNRKLAAQISALLERQGRKMPIPAR